MLSIIGLIPTILTFLTGLSGTVGKVSDNIKDLQIAKTTAANDKEKALIDAQIAEAHDRKDAIVAEAGSRINAFVRLALTIGPGAILLKLFLWDKVIGSFVGCSGPAARGLEGCGVYLTDPLDAYQWGVITAVVAFYFLYDMGKRK